MTAKMIRLAFLVVGVMAVVMPAEAQLGHPAKGTWLGEWGPNEQHMVILIDWQNDKLVGTINPGPGAVKVKEAKIDYDTWTMTLQADLPADGGKAQAWTATGKIDNLGSWTNRQYNGTYQYGNQKGDFKFVLQ